jgi:hypothetical protein
MKPYGASDERAMCCVSGGMRRRVEGHTGRVSLPAFAGVRGCSREAREARVDEVDGHCFVTGI